MREVWPQRGLAATRSGVTRSGRDLAQPDEHSRRGAASMSRSRRDVTPPRAELGDAARARRAASRTRRDARAFGDADGPVRRDDTATQPCFRADARTPPLTLCHGWSPQREASACARSVAFVRVASRASATSLWAELEDGRAALERAAAASRARARASVRRRSHDRVPVRRRRGARQVPAGPVEARGRD
mmetsp:Transcript_29058/g.89924  ORF Transcript_29058/g.89924 Transcript_29058/m.89924 type:complete len:189 (+) Transcript_29058:298-864(+)